MWRWFGGLVLAALFLIPQAHAQPADQAVAEGFVAALNGSPEARMAWLDGAVAARPRMPREEFPAVLEPIARAPGDVTLKSWTRRGGSLRLILGAGGRTGRVDLHFAPDEPGKLQGLQAVAVPTPYEGPIVSGPSQRAALIEAIDRRVRFAADRDELSGAVLVMKGDEVIYARAVGQADQSANRPNAMTTRFNLGSMDKQFTAVAVGQLIEQGKLSLDTRLIDVLPDYPNPEAARAITVRHLLSHSAGLGPMFGRLGYSQGMKFVRMADHFPAFAHLPLEYAPGARALYSNEGFAVLGAIVETVSGQGWYDYVRGNILAPAGMADTGWPTADEAWPNRAVGYRFADDDPLGLRGRSANSDRLVWRGSSFGGGYSTAADMVRFLQALRAGKLLKPETAALFTSPSPGGLRDYGFGFQSWRAASGRTVRGHDGGGPQSGINSDAKIVWETGYAYAVMGNYDAPFAQAVGRDIAEILAWQE